MGGFYRLSRTLNDPFHELHPHSTGETACSAWAWVDLIGMARWKESGGVQRGCVRASERFLATRWNWHRSRVTRFLTQLEEDGRIERNHEKGHKRGRKPGHITICNYDTYQIAGATSESNTRTTGRATKGAKEEVLSTKYEYTDSFELLWQVARKGSKKKALAQYRKAVPSKVDPGVIMRAYTAHTRAAGERKYVKSLELWIRDERWEEAVHLNGNGNRRSLKDVK